MKKKINTALPALSRMGVLLLIIVMGVIIDPSFLSLRNISNNLANASILIILGVGETVAIITNGPDLSAGSIMTMGGVVTAILLKNYQIHFVVAILGGLAVGALLGASCTVMTQGDPAFSAAVGLVAFFAAMSRCPVTAFLMGCEIFGWAAAPAFALAVAVAFSLGRDVGLYGRGATGILKRATSAARARLVMKKP